MSQYDISGGCDSCDSFMNDIPANQVMTMDNGSNMLAQMTMNNNTNSMMNNNVNSNSMMNNNVNSNSMMNTTSPMNNNMMGGMMNNAINTISAPPVMSNNIATAPQIQMPVQKPQRVMNNSQIMPANNNIQPTPVAPVAQKRVGLVNPYNLIMLGLVIISSLSWNETVKYHINQAVKFNDGSPMYYVAYAAITILVSIAAYNYISK